MAVNKDIFGLVEKIFAETGMALNESFTERVRLIGDSACKAGITAVVTYLSAKSELSEEDFEKLSVGKLPEDYRHQYLKKHIAEMNDQMDDKEMDLYNEAFLSGISTALSYLIKTANTKNIDLLATVISNN